LTRLSSFLAEVGAKSSNSNSAYLDAALLSSQFILDHMINENNLVYDYMYINGASVCTSTASSMWAYGSGALFEGFSVLADVSGDSKWRDA
jgi:hypothetical protein